MSIKGIKYHGKFYWTGRAWIKMVPRDAEPGVKGIDKLINFQLIN